MITMIGTANGPAYILRPHQLENDARFIERMRAMLIVLAATAPHLTATLHCPADEPPFCAVSGLPGYLPPPRRINSADVAQVWVRRDWPRHLQATLFSWQ